jgi:hypothetical protein
MGGGITSLRGSVTIENCTVDGNSGAGVVSWGGLVSISAATITANRRSGDPHAAGVANEKGYYGGPGVVTLRNSIVDGNYDDVSGGRIASDCAGSIVSGGHNLVGYADGCPGITNGVNGDIIGLESSLVIEPTIADNGGLT